MARQYDDKRVCLKRAGICKLLYDDGRHCRDWKNKADMLLAFARMKEIGGGIVLAENGNILHEIPLALCGCASSEAYEDVLEKEQKLRDLLTERGYEFCDPIYTLLFLQSTHLPYIRITPRGIFDVMKKLYSFHR